MFQKNNIIISNSGPPQHPPPQQAKVGHECDQVKVTHVDPPVASLLFELSAAAPASFGSVVTLCRYALGEERLPKSSPLLFAWRKSEVESY